MPNTPFSILEWLKDKAAFVRTVIFCLMWLV